MRLPHETNARSESAVVWEQFLTQREARRVRALSHAAMLRDGDEGLSPAQLFPSWRFSAIPPLASAAQSALADAAAVSPSPAQLWVALIPSDVLPDPAAAMRQPPWIFRQSLLERAVDGVEDTPHHRLAWALAELDFYGWETERRERLAWQETPYCPSPEQDAEAATLWASWFSGNPWGLRERWEALFLSPTIRTFRGVCEARRLPRSVIDRVTDDLEEGFFYRLIGGEGTPGWAELAARTLETAGPVVALAAALPPQAWDRLARCAATRGSWQDSCAAVYTELHEPASRARALLKACQQHPDQLDAWMDLHVVRRLLRAWQLAPETDAWTIISQNRGRARGRLRALIAGSQPDALLDKMMGQAPIEQRIQAHHL
ncbi:MAG: hypothetical protein AAFV53_03890, partial [Myxococcota bacterium]